MYRSDYGNVVTVVPCRIGYLRYGNNFEGNRRWLIIHFQNILKDPKLDDEEKAVRKAVYVDKVIALIYAFP